MSLLVALYSASLRISSSDEVRARAGTAAGTTALVRQAAQPVLLISPNAEVRIVESESCSTLSRLRIWSQMRMFGGGAAPE